MGQYSITIAISYANFSVISSKGIWKNSTRNPSMHFKPLSAVGPFV